MSPAKNRTTALPAVSVKKAGSGMLSFAKLAIVILMFSAAYGMHMLEGDPFAAALLFVFLAGAFVGKRW